MYQRDRQDQKQLTAGMWGTISEARQFTKTTSTNPHKPCASNEEDDEDDRKPSRAPSFSSLIRDVETFTSHSNKARNVMGREVRVDHPFCPAPHATKYSNMTSFLQYLQPLRAF
jgi:hypothetical protein